MTGLAEILDENRRLRESMAALHAELEAERSSRYVELARRHAEAEAAIAERDRTIATRDTELATQAAKLEAVQTRANALERLMQQIRLKAQGPASQRYIADNQPMLPWNRTITPPPRAPQAEAQEEDAEPSATPNPKKPRVAPRRRNRDEFAAMPSRPVVCKASKETCVRCGEELSVIGQATSFRVEWVPGHFIVEDVVRDKCACPKCPGEGVLTVPGPYALDRALCGNGLLARVLVDKFDDHLPLNRQAHRMEREGFVVGTNTLASWVKESAEWLGCVSEAVREELLTGCYLQGDDTGFPVQDGEDGALRKGRMWAFTDQEQVFYRFTPTKEGKYPAELLQKFKGNLLLVDGGSEFNEVCRKQGLQRGGCWSHCRTYFYNARHFHPHESEIALRTIRDLFLLERELHGRDLDHIRTMRRERAKPAIDGFFQWLEAIASVTRPKSALGEAIRYALNQREPLCLHLENPELPMHNNVSELMLRQTVVGRKNWLFARSEGGAEAAGHLYTLIGSCKLQGIDPHAYLVDVLGRIQDHPANRVAELTPKAWRRRMEIHPVNAS